MTAFAAAPRVPLLAHVVIVHPVAIQLVPFPARSQSVAQATHPGLNVGVPPTTALLAKAVLLVILESHGLEIVPVKVRVAPLHTVGITGIRTVSVPRGVEIAVVLVQVTPVPT